MDPLRQHTGIVVPLDRANVDTDAIIPKQFLRRIERSGFGRHLFHEWRFVDEEGQKENPDFILNQEPYRQASILLARENFGCGSSREHAPWALADFGFRVILAPSFADIFYNNSLKNGILLIRLGRSVIDDLFTQMTARPGASLSVDLDRQIVTDPAGRKYSFDIHPFARHCLLNGLDQIDWTLQFEDKISAFEENIHKTKPWLG